MARMLFLCLLSIAEIVADFALEKYANGGALSQLGVGVAGYAGVVYLLIRTLTGSSILYVNSMWDGLSSALESVAAIIFLGERLDAPWRYSGILFILLGMTILKGAQNPPSSSATT